MHSDTSSIFSPYGSASGRAYRPDPGLKVVLGFCVVTCGIGAIVFGWVGFTGPNGAQFVTIPTAVACLGIGLFLLLSLFKWATVLYPDRVEKRDLFGSRALRKAEIAGYRIRSQRYGPPVMRLVPRNSGVKPLSVYVFNRDASFDLWLDGMRDLDAIDREAIEARLLNDPALGADPDQRKARLARLKQIAIGYNGLVIAVCAWAWIAPQPYRLVVAALMAIPPAALLLAYWSRGALSLTGGKTDPRPGVGIGALAGVVLAARALDAQMIDLAGAFIGGFAIAALMTGMAYFLEARSPAGRGGVFAIALLALIYGVSAVNLLDRVADTSKPTIMKSVVLEKWVHRGKSTSWNVRVAPWGPVEHEAAIGVASRLYDQVAVGDAVCMHLQAGTFGMRWYTLQLCPSPLVATAPALPPAHDLQLATVPANEDMVRLYPDLAMRQNREGMTKYSCTVTSDGGLSECQVLSEAPSGYGFAMATLALVKLMRVNATAPNGQSTVGRTFVGTISWRLPR